MTEWISIYEKPLCEHCDYEGGFDILVDETFLAYVPTNKGGDYYLCHIREDGSLWSTDGDYDIGYRWDDVSHWCIVTPPEQE